MDLGLEGRALILTGAYGAIGRPTAELLAAEGARLLLVDRDEEALTALAAALPGEGHAIHACDLREPAAATATVATAVDRLGSLAGLVNLAAVLVPRSLEELDVELWDLHHEVNVRSSFLLARAAAGAMAPGGAIALLSSGAWLTGARADRVHYGATKGAVTTMVRGLARVLGPRGIRVNGIAPGMLDTPMMNADLPAEARAALERETPLGRFGEPREIAPWIALVVSPAASFMTGSTIAVTGGHVLH
ncbi:MAG: SDR family oxidoreductase [Actinobacteria bacterium]|nr:SDR family oxidoreductase [Actinomycetota bacterium]